MSGEMGDRQWGREKGEGGLTSWRLLSLYVARSRWLPTLRSISCEGRDREKAAGRDREKAAGVRVCVPCVPGGA